MANKQHEVELKEIMVENIHLANLIGVTVQHLRNMVNNYGMPESNKKGIYDLNACIKWYIGFLKKEIEELKYGTESEKKIKLNYFKAKSEREMIEVQKLKDELISVDILKETLSNVFISIKTKLLSWSKTLPKNLNNRELSEIESIIDKEVKKLLLELKDGD